MLPRRRRADDSRRATRVMVAYLGVVVMTSPAAVPLGPAWRIGIALVLTVCACLVSAWVAYNIPPSQALRASAVRLGVLATYTWAGGFLCGDELYRWLVGLAGGTMSPSALHASCDLALAGCYGVAGYVGSLVGAVLVAGRRRRYWDSLGSDYCVCCGYDLTGNMSGKCPECGTAIASTDRSGPAQGGKTQ